MRVGEYNPRYRNSAEYRRNRATVLGESDICGICGHEGAMTCDHKMPFWLWMETYGTADGFDAIENLQPAHGMLSNPVRYNYCPVCKVLCNERKHHSVAPTSPRSRRW